MTLARTEAVRERDTGTSGGNNIPGQTGCRCKGPGARACLELKDDRTGQGRGSREGTQTRGRGAASVLWAGLELLCGRSWEAKGGRDAAQLMV